MKISIIVPCLNEEKTITHLLEGIRGQTYPLDEVEVVISDGFSVDNTRIRIADYSQAHPDLAIRVIDNPDRTIPAGLNRAIKASNAEFIIRLDAHSVPHADYVVRCVEALESGKADNVGGIWLIRPGKEDWIGRSIAQAGSHPLGVGDARYRFASEPDYVETVPFGAFRRAYLEQIGLFNESLLSNEDYELNNRIIQSGGKIWMDPAIKAEYFARPTLTDLAIQYWRYGYWKAQMLKRFPNSIRLRQALPPLFVLGLLVLTGLSIFFPPLRGVLIGILVLYFGILIATSAVIALRKQYLPFIIGVPLAICVMHVCWGSGFLWSIIPLRHNDAV